MQYQAIYVDIYIPSLMFVALNAAEIKPMKPGHHGEIFVSTVLRRPESYETETGYVNITDICRYSHTQSQVRSFKCG